MESVSGHNRGTGEGREGFRRRRVSLEPGLSRRQKEVGKEHAPGEGRGCWPRPTCVAQVASAQV